MIAVLFLNFLLEISERGDYIITVFQREYEWYSNLLLQDVNGKVTLISENIFSVFWVLQAKL